MKIKSLFSSWNEYYANYSNENINFEGNNKIFGNHSEINSALYVNSCTFVNITHNKNGGALHAYDEQQEFIVLIERCTFISCKAHSGGAVYFHNNNGRIVIAKVCSYDCLSVYNDDQNQAGHFCLTRLENNQNENYLKEASVSHSIAIDMTRTINHYDGKHILKYTNVTQNSCKSCSCYNSYKASPLEISFCSFLNNTDKENSCIWIESPKRESNMDSCNIIENKIITTSSVSLIRQTFDSNSLGKIININNCNIVENNFTKLYSSTNEAMAKLNNCFIDPTYDSHEEYVLISSPKSESNVIEFNYYMKKVCQTPKEVEITDANDVFIPKKVPKIFFTFLSYISTQ